MVERKVTKVDRQVRKNLITQDPNFSFSFTLEPDAQDSLGLEGMDCELRRHFPEKRQRKQKKKLRKRPPKVVAAASVRSVKREALLFRVHLVFGVEKGEAVSTPECTVTVREHNASTSWLAAVEVCFDTEIPGAMRQQFKHLAYRVGELVYKKASAARRKEGI